MRRILTLVVLVGLAASAWGAAISLPAAAQGAPAVAVVGQNCSTAQSGRVAATIAWRLDGADAESVWLDLSAIDDKFAPDSFAQAGPISPDRGTFTWDGLLPGQVHYLRAQVLYPDGWRTGPTINFLTGNCSSAAGLLKVDQECSDEPGKVRVTFSWAPNLNPETSQWLDLSLQGPSFAPGSFTSVGPMPAWRSSYTWDGIEAGALHHWRINTLSGNEWLTSPVEAFFTLHCGANPTSANPDMIALRERLRAEVQASGLNAALAVLDLQTGESIDVRGDEARLPGCTINFFVLLSVVMDVEAGLYPESDVGGLISSTTWSSNAVTARSLLIKTGGGDIRAGVDKVNKLIRTLGLKTSLYDHAPAFFPEYSLLGSSNILTANEINQALANFFSGGIVSPQWRDYLIKKLTEVKPGLQYLIPAGVGAATVAHKNGFFPSSNGWIDNDAGIVIFESGGHQYAYVVSFFTQDVSVKYADIPLGQTVSSLVWQYFRGRYG
jgi:beta-lactamase class A